MHCETNLNLVLVTKLKEGGQVDAGREDLALAANENRSHALRLAGLVDGPAKGFIQLQTDGIALVGPATPIG